MGVNISKEKCNLPMSEDMKAELIKRMTDELIFLRTKLGLSQDELSNFIGISRQTYSTLEAKKRFMSWGTYLSLVFVFDNYQQTRDIIRENKIFPYRLFNKTESVLQEKQSMDISRLLSEDIKDKLDEQAMHTIRTVVMLEYARCNKLSAEEVIKEFDGR